MISSPFSLAFFCATTLSSLAANSDASAFTVATGPENTEDSYSTTLSAFDGLQDRETAPVLSLDNTTPGSLISIAESPSNLFSESPNLFDATTLTLADGPSALDSTSSDLIDWTTDEKNSLIFPISDEPTDQQGIFQPLNSAFPAQPPNPDNVGEAENAQILSFLDTDTPIFPIDPGKVIQDLIPDIDINPLDLLPQVLPPIVKPSCEEGYFPFCCTQGPPNPVTDKEKQKRRRKCYDCGFIFFHKLLLSNSSVEGLSANKDVDGALVPACQWHENIFCCFCKDKVHFHTRLRYLEKSNSAKQL